MVREELWQEIHRVFEQERWSKVAIARAFGLDLKTVRRCLQQGAWAPYQRPAQAGRRLAEHAAFLRERVAAVGYSARILFQELAQQHGYIGSYETVKRFVRPRRDAGALAERAVVRFDTPPGLQSQIDWGQALIPFRAGRAVRHIFILMLGFSRRARLLGSVGDTGRARADDTVR
jgi:transposase